MDKLYYDKSELFDLVNCEITDIDLTKLYPLTVDVDSEVRQLAAELLARYPTLRSENALIAMLNDDDELVRAEVCDSLSFYSSEKVLDALMISLKNDESEIVRSYALLSYWDVYLNCSSLYQKEAITRILSELFELEKSLYVKLDYAGLLYLCGNWDMLELLLGGLNNSDAYIRNTVMNNLVKICNRDNIHFLQTELKPYYTKEPAEFVKKKMEAFLCYKEDMLDILKNEQESYD